MTFEIEVEGFANGIAYFSIKGRPDLGRFYLTGQMMDEVGIVGEAIITVEAINNG